MKKYITLIHEERDDGYRIGYHISTNLKKHQDFKQEMLGCNNIEDVKILEVKEVK